MLAASNQLDTATLRSILLFLLLLLPLPAWSEKAVTLLFTNDFESAYDPVPAYWRDDIENIGGIGELAALIKRYRATAENVFLFDAGDIFTGTLAKRTKGELSFELLMTMGYDAMAIGNHEFEYGWQELARQKHRVAFPVLGANLFYQGTEHPYAQPYAIVERNGVRVGVIGILGQDAGTALIPSNIAGVEVRDPVPIVRDHVAYLRDAVDLIVVLTHQGATAPMQTDDEADPNVQRGNAENMTLAGAVPGIDVILAGHTDAGTREPLVHPETGTLVMQTFGQGQHLGVLELVLDDSGRRVSHDGDLMPVVSDGLLPDPAVMAKLARYRAAHPDIYQTVGYSAAYLSRRYYEESDLGNLFADILRTETGADIALMPSGALRKDLPLGQVRRVDLLDAFPFEDDIAVVEVSGNLLRAILEQGLSLERGMLQVSGLVAEYDPAQPSGQRLMNVRIGERPLQADALYRIATLEILAQGGDAYVQFNEANSKVFLERPFAEVLEAYFAARDVVRVPVRGRLVPVDT